MNFEKDGNLQAKLIIKFRDNVDFAMDEQLVKDELRRRFGSDSRPTCQFLVTAKIVDIELNITNTESVLLSWQGLFRDNLSARVFVPEGIRAADYDKYLKKRPYLMSFNYEDVKPFNPLPKE